ncbi:MAG: hypothetical protein K9M98_08895 [Cephaloticoccus sp.]|nr:hypothetical protein [Cephaloticoccus sp.]MCF7760608.1 hypothetical protein [Cephaloticoccus sp.]
MDTPTPKTPSPSQLSKTPSWISIGFVLGALFVWLLPRPEPTVIEVPVKAEEPQTLVVTRTKPDFSELEAVFSEWGRYAVWEHDLTELALWDVDTRQFSRFYEILRSGGNYYYRSIARLTRPVLTHGVKVNAPMLFTEPESARQEWLKQKDEETWKGISNSIRLQTTPTPRTTTGDGR